MCFANAEPPLSREELAAELEDIERLTDLLPFEKQNPDFLKQRFSGKRINPLGCRNEARYSKNHQQAGAT
ncbi:MAG: hypothetical protein Q8Q40_05810 [Methylococcaceae bacterium]|nr:hypothetical protein [Methylococcaceae bacterium]MDP3903470.1 hypothetical protein [Methylococcaceae bacterium]